jgi:hypothetical protein
MMYYYWKNGRVRPSVFYNMAKGEQLVIRAFYELEIKEPKPNTGCPLLDGWR